MTPQRAVTGGQLRSEARLVCREHDLECLPQFSRDRYGGTVRHDIGEVDVGSHVIEITADLISE